MERIVEVKPIETVYNGYRFRSRLEARWAVFFDACEIKYQYEPQGFDLGDGLFYLPDFYLPDLDVWVEVKGVLTEIDKKKIDRFRGIIKENGNPISLLVLRSIPTESEALNAQSNGWENYESFDMGYDGPYLFCACPRCGKVGIEFDGRGERVCDKYSPGYKQYTYDDPKILGAYDKARKSRFEHGEIP